ncbi:hypothetical protein J4558_06445 [Leptolyngbya sp. 15MV]|nr:hypothetical protein J4558_06445 [Leptolyngbya sp. 15MV]
MRRQVEEGERKGGEERTVERRTHVIRHDGRVLSAEEHARIREEVRESMKDMQVDLEGARSAQRLAMAEMRRSLGTAPRFGTLCKDGAPGTVLEMRVDGKVMTVCPPQVHAQAHAHAHAQANAQALAGITQARAAIAANREMDEAIRQQVLSALDAEIARMATDKN